MDQKAVSFIPDTKLTATLYLAEREKRGHAIQNPEGKKWRMLAPNELIKLAREIWLKEKGFT